MRSLGWSIATLHGVVHQIQDSIMTGETLNTIMLDQTELANFLTTSNTMLAKTKKKIAVDANTAYGSNRVSISRSVQNKVLSVLMVFDTIQIDESIPTILKEIVPSTWLNGPALEIFQVRNNLYGMLHMEM